MTLSALQGIEGAVWGAGAPFVAAAGSVTGRDHRRAERDGQDGYALIARPGVVGAVVTDGCGSGRASEIGARLGAAWIATLAERTFCGVATPAEARDAAEEVVRELLARLEVLARSLDPAFELRADRIEEALLFTFLAAVVTPSTAVVFGIGDGLVSVDGAVTTLDPGPDNAPPYAAYGLLGARLEPRIHHVVEAADCGAIAIATDGLLGALDSLPELTADRRYVRNPSLLRKRLVVLSDQGRLADDATLAVIQRREVAR
jgi:hypothetical protein